jgi:hypothetical protein
MAECIVLGTSSHPYDTQGGMNNEGFDADHLDVEDFEPDLDVLGVS